MLWYGVQHLGHIVPSPPQPRAGRVQLQGGCSWQQPAPRCRQTPQPAFVETFNKPIKNDSSARVSEALGGEREEEEEEEKGAGC